MKYYSPKHWKDIKKWVKLKGKAYFHTSSFWYLAVFRGVQEMSEIEDFVLYTIEKETG